MVRPEMKFIFLEGIHGEVQYDRSVCVYGLFSYCICRLRGTAKHCDKGSCTESWGKIPVSLKSETELQPSSAFCINPGLCK